jgi:uncharacterized protein (DUF58 family)
LADSSDRDFLDSAVLGRLARLQVHSRLPMIGNVTGMHKSPHRGSSVEFAEYRKYVPGDDIRHIDWRVLARTDRYYMKEFEADTNLRCYMVIDRSASMGFAGGEVSKLDFARKLAATLAYLLVHQGDAVGMQCFSKKIDQEVPPRHNAAHLKNLFDLLAEIKPEGETEIIDILHEIAEKNRQRALILIFSDFLVDPAELMDCFQHLRYRKHDLAIFHLLDRAELDFDFDRPIRFMDMESSFSMVTDPVTLRGRYLDALYKHADGLKQGCSEHQIDYLRVVTDEDYEGLLANFLLSRMNK